MKNKRAYRIIVNIILVLAICIISNYFVRRTNISNFPLFDSSSLFAYFGVLVGFAITIYTFGLTMVENIKTSVDDLKDVKDQDKDAIFEKLISGFREIKEDIWIIFYAIIIVVLFAILKNIENPFGLDVERLKIPETVNMTLFIYSTLCMFDIMRTLFNLSEINLNLLRRKNNSDNKLS
jgi:hypothetical protein